MKKLTSMILTALLLLNLCACGQMAPTWQEQYDLGMRYLSEGNYKEAIIAFTAAIEIDPKNTEAYLGRASAYRNDATTENALALALADYETVLTLDELCVDAYLGMAEIYIASGEENRVGEILSIGIEKTNDSKLQTKLDEFIEEEPMEPDTNPEPDTDPEPESVGTEINPEPMAGNSVTVYSQEELDALPLREDADMITEVGAYADFNDISALGSLKNLTTLATYIDDGRGLNKLSGLTNLTTLTLYNINTTDISALNKLTSLTKLTLYSNYNENLSAIQSLKGLTYLEIGPGGVGDISALKDLTNLTTLYLHGNDFSDVDIGVLSKLTNLTALKLSCDYINDISALGSLVKLKQLDLNGNSISDIGVLSGLTNLTGLDLGNTDISDIGALRSLRNLECINLYRTKISDISILGELTNLKELYLEGNNLSQQQIDELQALLPNCKIHF